MKISIIVPVYNVEKYVLECLNSISGLSLDYEIIVVNDGSKDGSLEVVNQFVSSFNGSIKVISKSNGGLSSARNIGILNANGDYLFFLDSDDYIVKKQFESFADDVIKDNVDIGFADYCYLRDGKIEANREAAYRKVIASKDNLIRDGISYAECFFDKRHNFFNVEACFLLIRRDLLLKNNILFREGIYHEDTLFTLSCLTVAQRVNFYNKTFYVYRMRDDSIMHTSNPRVIEQKFRDKGLIAQELYLLKNKRRISAMFLDSLIVELLLVSFMHFKRKNEFAKEVINRCKKLTIKSIIRVLIYRILSIKYVKS